MKIMSKVGDNNDEIMLAIMMKSFDENNNEEHQRSKSVPYIERHLEIGGEEGENFLIIPNGGSGDCMFKAVSQAVYRGNESKHREIRKRVVNFIISQRWAKFSESIEVQHINGNNLLQRQWAKDPKEAYKIYMCLAGTLGSISELTAAAELFQYNFATIQEYCNSTQTTYRVENCVQYNDEMTNFHYFYFTGDYDNGHWEYIKSLSENKLVDGTYQGRHRIVINGEEISFEDWLQRETENSNDADQLKIATNHDVYIRKRRSHPFELKGFNFGRDGTVQLKGTSFTIAPVLHSDLFSVLAHECLKNEASAHEIELILMKHRYSYFEDINYKLITQPWSHNFSVDTIRYCGQSLKGNIQDLISAADLYSFSFVLYLKMSDEEDTHQCKFMHVDRWGGESDRILYFFMRLSRQNDHFIAKWWRLIPQDSPNSAHVTKLLSRKSNSTLEEGESNTSSSNFSNVRSSSTTSADGSNLNPSQTSCIKSGKLTAVRGRSVQSGTASVLETVQDIFREPVLTQEALLNAKPSESGSNASSNENSVRSSQTYVASGRPLTSDTIDNEASLNLSSRPPSVHENGVRLEAVSVLEKMQDAFQITVVEEEQEEPKHQLFEGGITVTRISDSECDLQTDECLIKNLNKGFGASRPSYKSSVVVVNTKKPASSKKLTSVGRKSNKAIFKKEKVRPSTGTGAPKNKSEMKTNEKTYTEQELTYKGSGSMKANYLFMDLRRRTPAAIEKRPSTIIESARQSERSIQRMVCSAGADTGRAQYDGEDENSNVSNFMDPVGDTKNDQNEVSDVSYENFGSSPYYPPSAAVLQEENKRTQISQGQQFPPPELHPVKKEYMTRGKTNKCVKVAPSLVEPRQGYGQESDDKSLDSKYSETSFPCLNRLFQVLIAIITSIRKITRKVKKELIRKYEGRSNSSVKVNVTKKKKQFPHRR